MKDFKKYLKNKLNKQQIVGKATLTPPATTSVLQSSSTLSVLDLLTEGPIEGLVTRDGKYANGLRTLESFYLDDVPVKQLESIEPTVKDLPFSKLEFVSQLESQSYGVTNTIFKAFDNIITALSGHDQYSTNTQLLADIQIEKAQDFREKLRDFVEQHSGVERFGFAQYNISGIFDSNDKISGRSTLSSNILNLTTAFDFRNYLQQESGSDGLVPYKRQVGNPQDVSKEVNFLGITNIPEDFHFIAPIINTSETADLNQVGKIENLFRVDGFIGGGLFFFDVGNKANVGGTPDTTTDGGSSRFVLGTGNFFIDLTSGDRGAVDAAIASGVEKERDIFVYSGSNGGISLESATNQITPVKGLTDGSNLKIGFVSDLNSTYNYTNVSLDFRFGSEEQPLLEGYGQSRQDFVVGQKLFGPLKYGGKATGNADDLAATGSVGGYSDQRNAGDFSAWMSNPPLEHDTYPYTRIIERMDIDRVEPTFQIEVLYDTIDAGDDAGTLKPASLGVGVVYGFEGDIDHAKGTVGDDSVGRRNRISELLSDGNSIRSLALAQYRKTTNKIFTSIIQNSYLNSVTEVDDLPNPESLKNARIDQTTIPGLHSSHLTDFDLTSGELLYPNNSWKDVNRYMTVRKLSPETDSSLIQRSCSISYYTEIIKEKFTYPYSAIAGSSFDARTFAKQPSRQFDLRLKKILIPSNYEPLNPDGSDKRFIEKSSTYGLRDIYKFKTDEGAAASRDVDLTAHENLKIKGKIKFPTANLNLHDFDRIFEINRPGSGTDNMPYISFWYNDSSDIFQVRYNKNDSGSSSYAYVGVSHPRADHNAGDIYEFTITLVGSNLTLEVVRDGISIGSKTITTATRGDRPGVRYYIGVSEPNIPPVDNRFAVNDVQIADYQIYINGELKHWWDGTIIKTKKLRFALRDKVAGNHLEIIGTGADENDTIDVETDSNFEFGRNKSILYNGHWDGTFKLGWTDNPAWILYDLMINPMYGVGNYIDDREDIDIFQLFEIARHCDAVDADGLFDGVSDSTQGLEPRFSCNVRIAKPKNAFEVLGNIASVFRAISFWNGSSLTFSSDREKPIAAIFNNGNVYDGFFNYGDILSNARFTRVEVPYPDARDEFTIKSEYIEDEERIRKYGVITNTANGIGCTSKSQARRLGKYIMLSNKLETEIVSFKVGNEGMILEPGDIIRIDDEIKNFEINYGKILEISTGVPGTQSPYLIIENQINTGSIITGDNFGGLYAYNSEPQTPLEELYDISVYNSRHTFGADNNVISGKIPIETIEKSRQPQISKFYITGIIEVENGLKLNLNSGNENFSSITGVRQGTFCNVELNNQVSGEFKVVSIKPGEDNLYSIEALQYERRKFNMIEEDDFDLEENNYNIGIPLNTINRPSAPEFNFGIFEAPNSLFSVTGNIIGAPGSNETEYRVTVLKTNRSAPYTQRIFLKNDISEGEGTQFRINGLVDGDYSVRVTALQNPESAPTKYKNFTIEPLRQRYIKPLIFKINGDINVSQTRDNGTGYGEIQYLSNDCTYDIKVVNVHGKNVTIPQSNFSVNVYAKTGQNYNLVKQNHRENQYTFTEVQNRLTYGQTNTGFQLRFDLIQNEQTIDTSYYDTTIV